MSSTHKFKRILSDGGRAANQMNTQILEYIIAISQEKSLSKAADRLLVTQPALSQQLKKLEQELDAKLFQREKNELVLTDAGKVYVNGARTVLGIYQNALEEVKEIKNAGKKQITLVYNSPLLPDFTTKLLPKFMEMHPNIFFRAVEGNASAAKEYLTNGMAEMAVLATNEQSHSMLEYHPLYQDELRLALPSDHLWVKQFTEQGVDFKALKKDHFILNQSKSYFRTQEEEIFNIYQFTPNVLCEISDLNIAKHMVMNHRGNAFLPKSMMEEGDGYISFPLKPPAVFQVVIAYHKSVILTKAMRNLMALLKELYAVSKEDADTSHR